MTQLKLNDDLSAFAELVLPAVAEGSALDRMTLPKYELFRAKKSDMKKKTGAAADVALDTFFACHNDEPLVIDLRNLVLEVPIDDDSVNFDVANDGISLDADLDALRVTGKLWLDWPKDSGVLCTTGSNYHVELPFTIRGADLEARLDLEASGGNPSVASLDIESLALGSVDLDHDALNFATDALLVLADVVASVAQELADRNIDAAPENGVCNTPGNNADLDRCVESVLAVHAVPELESALEEVIENAVAKAMPAPLALSSSGFSADLSLDVQSISEKPQKDAVLVDIGGELTSTAPTAACASALTRANPLASDGTFEPMGDIDLIVPYNNLQDVAYEASRQGLLCVPVAHPRFPVSLTLEPAGPVTVVTSSPFTDASTLGAGVVSGTQTGSSGGVSATPTSYSGTGVATGTGASGDTSGSGFEMTQAPLANGLGIRIEDLIFTRHPSRLGYPAGAATGNIQVTVELGWLIDVDCEGQITVDLVTATHSGATGSLTARGRSLDAGDPGLVAQLDSAVATLPGRFNQRPLGPSLNELELLRGVVVSLVAFERAERELAIGFALSDRRAAGCGDPGTSAPPPVGDDTPDNDIPNFVPVDDPRNPGGTTTTHDPETLGGTSGQATAGSLSGN